MFIILFCQILTNSIFGNAELIFDTQIRDNGLEDVEEGKYTYVVALLEIFKDDDNTDDIFGFCTGSLINERWALTAAHCLEKRLDEELYVWYDDFTISPLVTKLFSKILKAIMHPLYNSRSFSLDYDISLLLVRQVNIRSYGMLSALDYTTMVGLPVTSVSGSRTNEPKNHTMRLLWFGGSKVIECDVDIKNLSKYVLCIIPKLSDSWQRICFGDSGGPALYDGKIIGICAFAFVSNVTVGVFTPVSPFRQWIHEVVHMNISEHDTTKQNIVSINTTESKLSRQIKLASNKYLPTNLDTLKLNDVTTN